MVLFFRGLFFTALVVSGIAFFFAQYNTIDIEPHAPPPPPQAKISKVDIPKSQIKPPTPKRPSKISTLEKPSAMSSSPFAGLKSFGNAGGGGLISQTDQHASASNSFSSSKSSQTADVQILSTSEPQFPEAAKRKNITGFVRLQITIDQSSAIKSIDILEAIPEGVFEAAAIDSIRNWRFSAAYQNGAPIEATIKRKIEFKLE
ncbi:MAG: TonB family protein [Bdellovibrionaceae bacterium]|nr:TonB family protein [Pseudobdellovibrionaceae bacterium]